MWAFDKARYSKLLLLLLRLCLASLYMLVLIEICVLIFVVHLLIHFILILVHGYLLVILWWSLYVDLLSFCKSWHDDGYNCLNTYLYTLWSTLILISCISSHSSLSLCLMSSLPKRERMCTKWVELLLIEWLREENMINSYLRGRDYIESVRGSWFQEEFWVWDFLTRFVLVLSFS
jgi:hypothetical protein